MRRKHSKKRRRREKKGSVEEKNVSKLVIVDDLFLFCVFVFSGILVRRWISLGRGELERAQFSWLLSFFFKTKGRPLFPSPFFWIHPGHRNFESLFFCVSGGGFFPNLCSCVDLEFLGWRDIHSIFFWGDFDSSFLLVLNKYIFCVCGRSAKKKSFPSAKLFRKIWQLLQLHPCFLKNPPNFPKIAHKDVVARSDFHWGEEDWTVFGPGRVEIYARGGLLYGSDKGRKVRCIASNEQHLVSKEEISPQNNLEIFFEKEKRGKTTAKRGEK